MQSGRERIVGQQPVLRSCMVAQSPHINDTFLGKREMRRVCLLYIEEKRELCKNGSGCE